VELRHATLAGQLERAARQNEFWSTARGALHLNLVPRGTPQPDAERLQKSFFRRESSSQSLTRASGIVDLAWGE
jgi:hypothetical protein